jgi:hypothetical protein
VGQFALQGPYLPLLELQARWIAGVWSAMSTAPRESAMRANVDVPPPATDAHNVLALALSEAAEVAPDIDRHPELAEPLLFGPMLPPRYRVDGPGALDTAAETFAQQLRTSPRPALDPYDLEMYAKLRLQQQLGPAKT